MGAVDLGRFGSSLYRTPNIDHLAAQGTRFVRAYTACSVCSPTRASLQTGKCPARLHITDWLTGHKKPFARMTVPDWRTTGLPDEETTLGESLKTRGYATARLGKWHLGGDLKNHGCDAGGRD